MTIHATDLLPPLREESARLLASAGSLDADAVARPSQCAGWTRGHVLSHLARHAEAVAAVLRDLSALPADRRRAGGVIEGLRPVYAGNDERARDIDAHAADDPHELVTALETAIGSLDRAFTALPPDTAGCEVLRTPSGPAVPVTAQLPARLREVVVHHCDLRAGYDYAGIAEPVAAILLDDTLGRLARAGTPVVADGEDLVLPDRRRVHETAPGGFLAWLLRQRTDGVRTEDGTLPALPGV